MGFSDSNGAKFSFSDAGALNMTGGGSLVFSTVYSRISQQGKVLIWQFKFAQTTAGTGGSAVGFAIPNSLSVADRDNCGFAFVNDWLNGNETNGMAAYTSSNVVYFRTVEQGSFLDLLGSHFSGNANVNFIAGSLMFELT